MSRVLDQNVFLVKEHIDSLNALCHFDIYDPETGEVILECREPPLGWFAKFLRSTGHKWMTPFDIDVKTLNGRRVVRVERDISLFMSKVVVRDEFDIIIGGFQQRPFSIGGEFDVLNEGGEVICTLEGDWMGRDFYFKNGEQEYAHISKEWTGLVQEMFTSADDYVLEIASDVPEGDVIRKLILAAILCIDIVLTK